MIRSAGCVVALSVSVLACAARQPVIYSSLERPEVERAVRACQSRADAARADGTLRRLVREAAKKATVAVPAGAVAGLLNRRTANGALAGAAAGAALAVAGAAVDSLEDDSLYVKYMELCLSDAGHRLIGWQ